MPPASCSWCARELPGPDPLRPRPPRSGTFKEGAAGPVRVVKGGVESWWCFPRCWKKAHPEKPGRAKKGKKGKQNISLKGSRTTPLEDDVEAA